jgi:hypothetical protein
MLVRLGLGLVVIVRIWVEGRGRGGGYVESNPVSIHAGRSQIIKTELDGNGYFELKFTLSSVYQTHVRILVHSF